MTSRTSRFPAPARHRQPKQLAPRLVMIVASLFAGAVSFQRPAYSTETAFANLAEQEARVARSPDSVSKIAALEKRFWICDYIGSTRGIEGTHAVACGANFEEVKQIKFDGDFEKLLKWWQLNKIAQHKALESLAVRGTESE